MAPFDLTKSLKTAEMRLPPEGRRHRSDRGISRLPAPVIRELRKLLHGIERPRMLDVERSIEARCKKLGVRKPSRATLYNFIDGCPSHVYAISKLPAYVQQALYNLDLAGTVPGPQLAFYAFQYGDTRAASFAAGLPWLDLYQADRMRGWRARSQGLLRAAMRRRGIK